MFVEWELDNRRKALKMAIRVLLVNLKSVLVIFLILVHLLLVE